MSSSFLLWSFNVATFGNEFLVNWFVQSTLLIGIGLLIGRLLKNWDAALLSIVYRATLVATLLGPFATGLLAISGASGWSLHLPIRVVAADVTSAAPELVEQSLSISDEMDRLIASESDDALLPASSLESTAFPATTRASRAVQGPEESIPQRAGSPASFSAVDTNTAAAPSAFVIWLLLICFAAWISLSALFLTRLLLEWSRVQHLRRRSVPASASVYSLCEEVAASMNVATPEVRLHPLVSSPYLIGLARPAIMLPEDEDRLLVREVLIHELAHLCRGDCYWNLLVQIAGSIFFFQPLMRVLSQRMASTAEDVCDDFVVRLGGDRFQYASQLLHIAEQSVVPPICVGMISVRSMLRRRVTRILDSSRSLSTRVGNLILLTVCVIGVMVTMTAGLVGLAAQPTLAANDNRDLKEDEQSKTEQTNTAMKTASKPEATDVIPAAPGYEGTVIDPAGKPIAGANIYVVIYLREALGLLEPTWKPVATTNAEGRFRFGREELLAYEIAGPELWTRAALCVTADQYGFGWSRLASFDASGQSIKILRERSEKRPPESTAALLKSYKSAGQPIQLKVDDRPIQGQILTVEGRHVKGARVTLLRVQTGEDETLDEWLQLTSAERADFYSTRRGLRKSINGPQVRSLVKPVTTDAEGRFVMRGIGRDCIAELLIEGPGIQSDRIYVRTRPGETITMPNQWGRDGRNEFFYSNPMTHVAGPSQPIAGVVIDKITRKPIPGAVILSQKRSGYPMQGWGEDFVRTIADSEGRFQLDGMPIGDNRIGVISPGNLPYVPASHSMKTIVSNDPLKVDLDMHPGVWVAGRVTDKQTGQGLSGKFERFTFRDNKAGSPGRIDEREWLITDVQGQFRIAVAPGRGILAFQADINDKYPRGVGAQTIQGTMSPPGATTLHFDTLPSACMANNFQLLTEVDFSLDQKEVELNLILDASHNVQGRIIDPTGNPVTTVVYSGKFKEFGPSWFRLDTDGRFGIVSYDPAEPRVLAFADYDRKLAARVELAGAVPDPLIVTLQPAGNVTGRIVDERGDPIPDLELLSWWPSQVNLGPQMNANQVHERLPLPPRGARDSTVEGHICDANGRFELRGLVAGQEYRINVMGKDKKFGQRLLGPLDVVIKVKGGESLELGDVRITDEKSFLEKFKLLIKDDPK